MQNGIACNTRQHGVSERRGKQGLVADNEQIFAGTFTDVAIHIQGDAFGVAVDDGFHLDELRIHIVRAGFGHRRQRIGGDARPGRNTDIDALRSIGAKIFPPGIVADVDLGRRVERIHASFAISSENDGTDIARPDAIGLDEVDQASQNVFARKFHIDAIDASGIQQTLDMFLRAKDGGAGRQRVTTNPFKYRGAVIHYVRHHVQRGVIPWDELAVVPDFVGLLNGHQGSFGFDLLP